MPNPWIEFLGPPGVGKSTVCRETQFLTGLPDKSAAGSQDPAPLLDRDSDWRAFVDHVRKAYRDAQPGARESRQKTFERMLRRAAACLDADGVWLLDDFLVQRGQSLRAAGGRWHDVQRFFELVPAALGVVVLRCDPEAIKRRNFSRSISRPRKPDLSREVDEAIRVVESAVPILKGRGVAVLELNSDVAPIENAESVRTFISRQRAVASRR